MSNIQKNLKRQKLRNNEYYNFQEVQDELYAQSQNGKVFTDLMSKIISRENILLAYRNIKKNTGSNTKGVDGKTIANLAKMEPDDLNYIMERYGKSQRLRFAYNTALIPASYIQHQKALQYRNYSIYIASDRELIHAKQKAVPPENLKYLMTNPIRGQSSEYNDNLISLYVAQYGKCYVSGVELEVDEIHCHHKKPRALGGTDEYKNLAILHEDAHRLVHSTDSETINGYLSRLNLKAEQLERVNKLRELAKLQSVS